MSKSTSRVALALLLLVAANASIAEGSIVQPARFISNAPPKYPDDERRAGHAGTVKIRIRVDASGSIAAAEVSQSSGWPTLDEQALVAAKKWTFTPAKRADGTPVESLIQVPITFDASPDEELAGDMVVAVNQMIIKPCRDFLSEVEKQQAATPDKPPYSSVQSFATPWSLAFFGLTARGQNADATKVLRGREALFSAVQGECMSAPDAAYDVVFKAALKALLSQ